MMTWRRERSKIPRTERSDHVLSAGSSLKVGGEEQIHMQSSHYTSLMADVDRRYKLMTSTLVSVFGKDVFQFI